MKGRPLILAGAASALAVAAALLVLLRPGPTEEPAPSAASNPASGPGSTATGPGGAPPSVAYRRTEPVPLGTPADFGDDVLATVTGVVPVELAAQGPGTTAGSGVDVTVEVRNGSAEPYDLLGVAMTARYGEGTPAVPVPMASAPPLRGVLEPGQSASGAYAFRVPAEQIPTLTFELTSSSSPNVLTVRSR